MNISTGTVITIEPPGPIFATVAPPVSDAVVVLPVVGPPGAPGADGTGSTTVITEVDNGDGSVTLYTASTGGTATGRPAPTSISGTWSSFYAAHNYPYLPDVWIRDDTGQLVDTDVEYTDATHVAITFPVPFTGTITLG